MDSDKTKYLKKLIQDGLTEEERRDLNSYPEVSSYMEKQWMNDSKESSISSKKEIKIWNAIERRIWNKPSLIKMRFYQYYSVAATILILIAVLGIGYFWKAAASAEPYFVVSSGIQNMQEVKLPDGTVVQLGPESSLTYPQKFTGKQRIVSLKGQAFFDVMKNHRKPFIVETPNMNVEALGTAFEIFNYEIENKPEVILLNGKVKVGINDNDKKTLQFFLLNPDERLQLNRQTGDVKKWKVDADKYSAWRKQRFLAFENEKLSMIIPRLEKWYGRKVICEKDLAEKYRFTFKVRDESLERILYMICLSAPIKTEKMENENYIITLK